MVKSIHIQNFRCFEDLKLEGLGRVNLIGGMNNSGKTVLLEGVWVGVGQSPQNVISLKPMRYSNQNIWKSELKKDAWGDLFYQKDKSNKINILSASDNSLLRQTSIEYSQNTFDQVEKIIVEYRHNHNVFSRGELFVREDKKEPEGMSLYSDENSKIKEGGNIYYVAAKDFMDDRHLLAQLFSELELSGDTHYVLNGIKVIDNTITDIKIISLGEPSLYVKRENEPLMPIELFGDAIKKMAVMMIGILNSKDGILLIDEIENGIHQINQPKVWELIFKLAQKFNVQVFATTHSKEMAEAFNKMALDCGFGEDAKYIEMLRHYKTKKLVGTIMEMSTLKHILVQNKAFRGE